MKITKYIVPALSVMALVSCSSYDEPANNSGTFAISVSGSFPSLGATSRANEELRPTVPGECKADKVDLYIYNSENHENQANGLGLTNIRVNSFNGTDRYTTHIQSFNFGNVTSSTYCISALAYTNADKPMFNETPGTKSTHQLSLSGVATPELYYGYLEMGVPENTFSDNVNTVTHAKNASSDIPLGGDLYRIVSRFNVTINDISSESGIDHVDIICSDYPVKLNLWGTHGIWYPVSAVAKAADDTWFGTRDVDTTGDGVNDGVVVATDNKFVGGKANLSFFMLPSEKGTTLTARVVFKTKKQIAEENGQTIDNPSDPEWNEVRSTCIPLRPLNDYYLSRIASMVYTVVNDDMKMTDSNSNTIIKVYNESEGRFYSLSNVRLNISGSLKNIADIHVEIHVESAYEKEHNITL